MKNSLESFLKLFTILLVYAIGMTYWLQNWPQPEHSGNDEVTIGFTFLPAFFTALLFSFFVWAARSFFQIKSWPTQEGLTLKASMLRFLYLTIIGTIVCFIGYWLYNN